MMYKEYLFTLIKKMIINKKNTPLNTSFHVCAHCENNWAFVCKYEEPWRMLNCAIDIFVLCLYFACYVQKKMLHYTSIKGTVPENKYFPTFLVTYWDIDSARHRTDHVQNAVNGL